MNPRACGLLGRQRVAMLAAFGLAAGLATSFSLLPVGAQQITPLTPSKKPKAQPPKPAGTKQTPVTDQQQQPTQWLDGSVNGGPTGGAARVPVQAPGQPAVTPALPHAPRTPEELEGYFKKMKRIMGAFTSAMLPICMSGGGLTTDPDTLRTAGPQLSGLCSDIGATLPPDEMRATHNALPPVCRAVVNYCQAPSGGAASLMSAMTLMMNFLGTMDRYHTNCIQVITAHGLDQGLDPCAGGEGTVGQIMGMLPQFAQDKMNGLSGGGGQGGGFGGGGGWLNNDSSGSGAGAGGMGGLGGMMGGLGGMMSGMGGGAGASPPPDSSSPPADGGSGDGSGGLGGVDMGALQKMLGQ